MMGINAMPKIFLVVLLSLACALTGCQSAYYSAMEKMGYHKRDIMVDRVKDAKESQLDAKTQFNSALKELQALLNHDGGDLQIAYEKAKEEYESSRSAANALTSRIDNVENVANALFDEWQDEITQIQKGSLKSASQAKLNLTKASYSTLLISMRRSESKMEPILTAMKDNMLYLKHNLNAAAVGAIKGEFYNLRTDVSSLNREMTQSIKESNRFIASMKQ